MGQQGPLVAALKQCSKHIGEKRWIREHLSDMNICQKVHTTWSSKMVSVQKFEILAIVFAINALKIHYITGGLRDSAFVPHKRVMKSELAPKLLA